MRWNTLSIFGLALGLALGVGEAAAQGKQLSIATGGTGGVYYPLGGGFGNLIGKEIPGYTGTAEVTGGSVDNLKLIGTGKADLCFTQVDAAWDALNGLDKFSSGKLPIRPGGVDPGLLTKGGGNFEWRFDLQDRFISLGVTYLF